MTKIKSFKASFLDLVVKDVNNWLKKNDDKIEVINSNTCFDSHMYGEYIITILYRDKNGFGSTEK